MPSAKKLSAPVGVTSPNRSRKQSNGSAKVLAKDSQGVSAQLPSRSLSEGTIGQDGSEDVAKLGSSLAAPTVSDGKASKQDTTAIAIKKAKRRKNVADYQDIAELATHPVVQGTANSLPLVFTNTAE